eukprot:4664743-Pleurochrysis_carterae.AAC.1
MPSKSFVSRPSHARSKVAKRPACLAGILQSAYWMGTRTDLVTSSAASPHELQLLTLRTTFRKLTGARMCSDTSPTT